MDAIIAALYVSGLLAGVALSLRFVALWFHITRRF